MGATMRLGAMPCELVEGSHAREVYGVESAMERHRHRYEVNPDYHRALTDGGLRFSGWSPSRLLVEIIELPDHPFFMAGQFHPELKSRPTNPHPMFRDFVGAALGLREGADRGEREPVVVPG
jgi:CTP synthase